MANACMLGTAINTNCKYILLAYCFERLAMNRVQLKTDNENKRSQQAIERIGAKKRGFYAIIWCVKMERCAIHIYTVLRRKSGHK